VTSDDRSPDPFRPAGPDDVTSAYPAPSYPAPSYPVAAAAPTQPPQATIPVPATSDPFDRPIPVAPVAPVVAPPVHSRRGSGMLVNVVLGLALVVAVGGVAFAVGRATAPATAAATRTGFVPGAGGPNASGAPGGTFNGGLGGAAGGLSIQGTVTAVGADSITLLLASGQSITIPIDAQTTYHQREAATSVAVTNGSTVIVQLEGGRGALGNGDGGQGVGPNASGAPGRNPGRASTITVVPAGS